MTDCNEPGALFLIAYNGQLAAVDLTFQFSIMVSGCTRLMDDSVSWHFVLLRVI